MNKPKDKGTPTETEFRKPNDWLLKYLKVYRQVPDTENPQVPYPQRLYNQRGAKWQQNLEVE